MIMLSPELQQFYQEHSVEGVEHLSDSKSLPYRFVRLNPRFDKSETLQQLESEVGCPPVKVPFLIDETLSFYALPGEFALAQSSLFRSGKIYGMDVSSGAAVAALLSDHYDKKNTRNTTAKTRKTLASLTTHKPKEPWRVLDLCCSPGLKLCTIADCLSRDSRHSDAIVVGVDNSEPRMALCKRIVKKYHVDPETSGHAAMNHHDNKSVRIRLYCTDGVTFGTTEQNGGPNLVFDSSVAADDLIASGGKRKRMNKSARARERKRLKQLVASDMVSADAPDQQPLAATTGVDGGQHVTVKLFDRVLVDAECSTDGSLKHVQKRLEKYQEMANTDEADTMEHNPRLMDRKELSDLVLLQQNLAASGFRLLKPGGFMVYSTCSLSREQNENVVSWLLEQNSDAYLRPLEFRNGEDATECNMIAEGSIEGTIRFLPSIVLPSDANDAAPQQKQPGLFGGGFFLAKIGKK